GADQVDIDVARPSDGIGFHEGANRSITPALLTKMSGFPNRRTVSPTIAATAAYSATSQATPQASPPLATMPSVTREAAIPSRATIITDATCACQRYSCCRADPAASTGDDRDLSD